MEAGVANDIQAAGFNVRHENIENASYVLQQTVMEADGSVTDQYNLPDWGRFMWSTLFEGVRGGMGAYGFG